MGHANDRVRTVSGISDPLALIRPIPPRDASFTGAASHDNLFPSDRESDGVTGLDSLRAGYD